MPVSQNRVFKTSLVSLKKYGNLGEKNLVNGLRQISQKVEILYSHLFLHIHGLLSHVPRIVWDFLFRRGHIDTEVDQIWVGVKTNFWWFCCNYNKEFYEKIPWLRPIVSDLDQEKTAWELTARDYVSLLLREKWRSHSDLEKVLEIFYTFQSRLQSCRTQVATIAYKHPSNCDSVSILQWHRSYPEMSFENVVLVKVPKIKN